jgi:formylglycine-generating enzyme required for sulfatase activity
MAKRVLTIASLVPFLAFVGYQLIDAKIFDSAQVQAPQRCSQPLGMAFIEGDTYTMGAGAVYPEELPAIQREVKAFYIDRHEVTNLQFAKFVDATGYVKMAQRYPNAADYPGIDPELLIPGSAVFVKLSQAVEAATFAN